MRRFVLGLFAMIGLLAVLAIAGIGVVVWRFAAYQPLLPATMILSADLGRGLTEGPSQSPLAELAFGAKPTLRGFLDALERGADDSRIKGIYAHLGGDSLGLVRLIGLHAEVPFLRGTLDRLGIQPSFARREEYKSAANSLTETEMTG